MFNKPMQESSTCFFRNRLGRSRNQNRNPIHSKSNHNHNYMTVHLIWNSGCGFPQRIPRYLEIKHMKLRLPTPIKTNSIENAKLTVKRNSLWTVCLALLVLSILVPFVDQVKRTYNIYTFPQNAYFKQWVRFIKVRNKKWILML